MSLVDRVLGPRRGEPGIIQPSLEAAHRVGPLEGTNVSLWNDGNQIPQFWTENGLNDLGKMFWPGDGWLAERVWVANRCVQMNAQQIASMPLKFSAPNVSADSQPAWVSSPDPNWFPNGISDAMFAIVANMYGWGYAILYVTSFYAAGYPRTWTVLPSERVSVCMEDGGREYRFGDVDLDPERVIQIDRNPGCSVRGSSALRAYAQMSWGLLAAGNQSMSVSSGVLPSVYLKPQRKIDSEQAKELQKQWMTAAQGRNGAPPVVPPDLDVNELSFNPSDLALLETQEFNAKAICTAFGLPAQLLNLAIVRSGLTYTTTAMLGEYWWRFELRPTAKRVADALTARMLPAGQWVWFDATDTYLPLASDKTGPLASDEDDPQAADDPQSLEPAVAAASPGPAPLTVIGGTGT